MKKQIRQMIQVAIPTKDAIAGIGAQLGIKCQKAVELLQTTMAETINARPAIADTPTAITSLKGIIVCSYDLSRDHRGFDCFGESLKTIHLCPALYQ